MPWHPLSYWLRDLQRAGAGMPRLVVRSRHLFPRGGGPTVGAWLNDPA